MINTLKSRIFLFFTVILILTSSVTAFVVKNETEKALLHAADGHAKNLADTMQKSIVSSYNSIRYFRESLLQIKKDELENIVGIVYEILSHYHELARTGKISMERAKSEAADAVRMIKFSKGTGYVWINDTRQPLPRFLVHPMLPELENRPLLEQELSDAAGKGINFLSYVAQTALSREEAFIEYYWPRPGDTVSGEKVPKLSYIKLFRPWNWVIGSGVYIDDIEAETGKKKQSVIDDLSRMMAGIKIGETGYMYLFNSNLEILVHPYLKDSDAQGIINSATGNWVIKDLVDAAMAGKDEFIYPWNLSPSTPEKTKTRWKKAYIREIREFGWYLASSIYIDELTKPAKATGFKILMISFFFIALSSVIAFHISNSLSRPLKILSDAIHMAEKERHFDKAEFPEAGTDETIKLGQTLNSLVNSIINYRAESVKRMEKVSRLVENLNEKYIFFSCHSDGSVTFASRSLENITGYTREEFLPVFGEIIKNNGLLKLPQDPGPAKPVSFEITFTHKNSKTLFFEITEVPFTSPDNSILYFDGIIKDITEKKINEEKLRQAQKMETIGVLAGGLAHDFNNLLGGIIGPASLIRYLMDQAGSKLNEEETEKIKNYLAMIEESGGKASEIVRQLMSISREQKLNKSEVDLLTAVRHVVDICKNTFDKSVSINVSAEMETPVILADKTQIEQAVLNLCVNSYHAMTTMRPSGEVWGGSLDIDISRIIPDSFFAKTHPEAENTEYFCLSVRDTGIGIERENLEMIFTPFFTTKKETEGTGLGLTMTYNIIRQHRGFIDIYSEPGNGTTFKVFLPAAAEVQREDGKQEKTLIPQPGKGLVLVIDDEEIMRNVAKEILEHCGYRVITAANGREGLEIYRKPGMNFSAVLLDMAMPEMSGKETYIRLKEINPEIKVVLASGNRNDRRVSDALELGINHFLEKPYTMGRLSQVMKELTGNQT